MSDLHPRPTPPSTDGTGPLIGFDPVSFDPWRIQAVRHRLAEHPLLQPDALVELGARLETAGRIRTHGDDATAGTPFNTAPSLHPNRKSAAQTLGAIADAHAWMSLLNVQTDPVYRELVGSVLDSIQPLVERRDPGMCHRAGWIFVTSPNTVTPFHFDKEHNFILQVRGHKRVYVWDHRDTVVASELARDRFHTDNGRELLQWREEFRARAHVFDLKPGEGAYMPSTSPHMVENGDEPSITMSFTYYTRSTLRDSLLHKTHAWMRGKGLSPPPVGRWPLLDTLTHAGVSSAIDARRLARRMAGQAVPGGPGRYSIVGL